MAVPVMPSTAQYGYVVGRFLLAVGDTAADPDAYPEPLVPIGGKVTLTPVASVNLFPTSNPPVTVLPQPVVLTLDSDGDITDGAGNQGVWVITGQYDVSFNFVGVSIDTFRINVLSTHTALAPLDLTLAAPLPVSPATVFVVNQQVYIDTIAARDQTVAIAAALPDVTLLAPKANPTFTGTVAAPTPATSDNGTTVATTAFVKAQGYISSASPALTGTPTAPTAAVGTNTTQIANTAFVQAAVAALVNGSSAALDTLAELAAALGNDANFATTVSTNLGLKAPLASPTFTGTPAVPTAATATNTTQIASTAFVKAQGYAPLASPALTGTPTAPTAATSDNSTTVATTAFVKAAVSASGGYVSPLTTIGDTLYGGTGGVATRLAGNTSATKQFLTQTGTGTASVAPSWGTIAVADVSGAAPLASPSLTGTPSATTATAGDNSTRISTTAFVTAAQQMLTSVNMITGTTFTPTFANAGGLSIYNGAAAGILNIVANATVAFPIGTVMNFMLQGTNPWTITPASGVTILSTSGYRLTTQNAQASIVKIATDTWALSGQTVV